MQTQNLCVDGKPSAPTESLSDGRQLSHQSLEWRLVKDWNGQCSGRWLGPEGPWKRQSPSGWAEPSSLPAPQSSRQVKTQCLALQPWPQALLLLCATISPTTLWTECRASTHPRHQHWINWAGNRASYVENWLFCFPVNEKEHSWRAY